MLLTLTGIPIMYYQLDAIRAMGQIGKPALIFLNSRHFEMVEFIYSISTFHLYIQFEFVSTNRPATSVWKRKHC